MHRLYSLLLALCLIGASAYAQDQQNIHPARNGPVTLVTVDADPSGACSVYSVAFVNWQTGVQTGCVNGQYVSTDISAIPLATGISGILPIANGGTGTANPVVPPYLNLGGAKYVAGSGFLATLPSATPTWINSTAPPTFTVGANGDVLAGGAGGPFFAISNVTTSVEAEFTTFSNTSAAPLAGIWLYDSTNHLIYFFTHNYNGGPVISVGKYTWTGTGAATYAGSDAVSSIGYTGPSICHFKLSVSGSTMSVQVSIDGGATFTTLASVTVGTITKGGYGTNNSGVIDVLSLVTQ